MVDMLATQKAETTVLRKAGLTVEQLGFQLDLRTAVEKDGQSVETMVERSAVWSAVRWAVAMVDPLDGNWVVEKVDWWV
jgi:hypothetical protein